MSTRTHSLFDLCRPTGPALDPHPLRFVHVHNLDRGELEKSSQYRLFIRFDAACNAIPSIRQHDNEKCPRWFRTHSGITIAEINRNFDGEAISVGFGSKIGNMQCVGNEICHLSENLKKEYEKNFEWMEKRHMCLQIGQAVWWARTYIPALDGDVCDETWRRSDCYAELPITTEGFKRARDFIAEARENPPPYHIGGRTLLKGKWRGKKWQWGGKNCWRGVEDVMQAAGIVPKRDAPILDIPFPFPFLATGRIEEAARRGVRTSGTATIVSQRTVATWHAVHAYRSSKAIAVRTQAPDMALLQQRERHDAPHLVAIAA